MILDTYHDRQNGFIFGTTPVGLQYDAQVRNEGETIRGGPPTGWHRRQHSGAGAGVNVNWDGIWEVKTHVTTTAGPRNSCIPLRTLRYGPPPQIWGSTSRATSSEARSRSTGRRSSRIYSSRGCRRPASCAACRRRRPRDFKLMPYAIGSANRNFLSAAQTTYDRDGDWGIDAKFGVTSSMTLDLTYNTDFAQVEVDEQQINLTRFNLFFPRSGRSSSRTAGCSQSADPARSICSSAAGSASATTARCCRFAAARG